MSIFMSLSPILNEQESAIYIAALELGTDTIQHLATKANLPRSTTYLIMDELIEKGLVSRTVKGKKTLFTPEPPEQLLIYLKQQALALQEQQQQITTQLPLLKALENKHATKPLISYYEGLAGIQSILEKSYAAREIFVICSGYEKPMDKTLENYMFKDYFPKTNELKIRTREIITADPDLERYITEYGSENHQIKMSERKPASEHLDKLIFGNQVALVDYDRLNGTVMEHEGMAAFERELFNELWLKI